jgi:hypothetical protein
VTGAFIEYDSNNSGGYWWLDDDQWTALEAAGWIVHWVHDPDDPSHEHPERDDERWRFSFGKDHSHRSLAPLVKVRGNGERYMGALAVSAAKFTDDPAAAVAEWEDVTGLDASVEGCNCCGSPHNFTFTDADGNTQRTFVEVVRTVMRWS